MDIIIVKERGTSGKAKLIPLTERGYEWVIRNMDWKHFQKKLIVTVDEEGISDLEAMIKEIGLEVDVK